MTMENGTSSWGYRRGCYVTHPHTFFMIINQSDRTIYREHPIIGHSFHGEVEIVEPVHPFDAWMIRRDTYKV